MKKIISLLLTFALVFQLALPAMAAEGDNNQFTMKVDKTSVEVGDKVYVTVGCDSAFTNLSLMSVFVEYDDTVFEATETLYKAEDNANKSWDFHVQAVGENGYTTPTVLASIMDFNAGLNLSAGDYLTMEFTAIKASEGAKFTFTYPEVGDDNSDLVTYALKCPEDITVTVTPASSGGDDTGELVIPDGLNIARITAVTAFTQLDDMTYQLWGGTETSPCYIATVPAGTTSVVVTFKENSHSYSNNDYTNNEDWIYCAMIVDGDGGDGTNHVATQEEDGLWSITLDAADMIENGSYYCAYGPEYERLYLLGFQYDESTDTPHTCVFDQEVAEDKFLATAATCQAAATYYKSCTCGEKGTETFSSGDLGNHTYDEETHLCTVCNTQDPAYWTATVSFAGIAANTVGTVSQFPLHVEVANASAARSYDAITMVMTYDPAVLQVYTVNPNTATYTEESGVLTVTGAAGNFTTTAKSAPFRVIMQALALGDATVKLTSFKVDDTEIITDPVVLPISIGYPVTFPEVDGVTFSGDAYAPKNGSYSFTVSVADGYDKENMVVANNGTTLTAEADGTYTISSVSAAPGITVTGVEKVVSGQCGDNLYWTLKGGHLTITGTGDMYTFKSKAAPWQDYMTEITSVTLPDGLTNISKYAFMGATSLTGIVIPDAVTSIGTSAFSACSALTSATIGSSVQTIGGWAFYNCDLSTLVLPDSLTRLEDSYAFGSNANLTSVTFGSGLTYIGSQAFFKCEKLASVDLSATAVTEIGSTAFQQCTALASVKLPDTLTKISGSAFRYCKALTAITIPGSVTYIGDTTFADSGLKSIVIPDSVVTSSTYALSAAFKDCTSLESATLGTGVTLLNSEIFSGCTSLKTVTINGDVTAIKGSAFSGCTALTEITIPETVTAIAAKAFEGCTALTDIWFEGDAPTFGDSYSTAAFKNVTATAHYKEAKNWPDTAFKNYGGKLTWVSDHVHAYDQQVATEDYLASAATCQAKAKYYYSCTCGDKGEETFEYGDLGDHTYGEDGICTACGYQSLDSWTCTPAMASNLQENQNLALNATFNTVINLLNATGRLKVESLEATITYDPEVLQMSNYVDYTRQPQLLFGIVSDDGNGTVTVTRTDAELTAANSRGLCSLVWKTIGLGDATVTLQSLTINGKAIISEPVSFKETVGYPVTLPEGEGYAVLGEDYAPVNGTYSFEVEVDDDYDASEMVVQVNGTTITPDDNGTYTISSVSSAPAITVTGVKKDETTVDPDQPDVPAVTPAQSIGISGHGVSTTGDNTYTLTLCKGASSTLTAKVYPEDATNQNVVWSSDAEDVATVSQNGEITAVGVGTATITATVEQAETRSRAANVVSTIAVTVNDVDEGYTVKMPEDKTVVVGEKVSVGVTVGHTDGQTGYNAFDMTFTYDTNALTLNTTAEDLGGLTFTATEGTINVKGYGDNRAVDTVPFELEFTAVETGTSDITLTSAKVDNGANAIGADAPEANPIDENTSITVTGYPVQLPDGFQGNAVANPGEDYNFKAPEDNFDYNVTVKVDGNEVDVIDNGDGSYTIPADKVTGPIEISESHVGKTFSVTLGEDMEGNDTAQYGTPYTATLEKKDGYDYNVTITIGGETYTGYAMDGDTYTIPGEDITGAIVFDSGKTQQGGGEQPSTSHTVTFDGTGAGAAAGNATSVAHGAAYNFTLTKEKGYAYTVSASTASGTNVEVTENEDGSYTIASVTEDITIIIEKALDITVEVSEYVTLNDKVMFLVLVTGEHEDGKCFAYGGNAMVYSEVYDAYAYLTVESGEYNADTAKASITITDGENQTVSSANYDVNQTGLVDINDAQLVYDIYNGKYEDVSTLGLVKLLNADTVADKTVNVSDAIAVVSNIG